jgi:POT family proton-dependent oligopeptide transporter
MQTNSSSTQVTASKGHPTGLYILFATEMWERFNYYGMRAILVLFMTKALLFDKAFASNLYGSYTGLVYLTPLIGGFIADRYWGSQRSIIVGGIVMAIGEFILFGCASIYDTNTSLATILFFSGLGFMIAGNGFFKPNISSLVGQLYPKGDRRIDPAYTIFYMGINTGGAIGPIVCGLVGETGNPHDFKWAFLAGGIAMIISVVVQAMFAKQYVVDNEGKPLGTTPKQVAVVWFKPLTIIVGFAAFAALAIALLYVDANVFPYLPYLLLASALLIAFIIFTDKSLSKFEKEKVSVIFIVSFFVIFFWSAFEQAGASLTFFADEQTDRRLGLNIPSWVAYPVAAAALFGVWHLIKRVTVNFSDAIHSKLKSVVLALLVLLVAVIVFGLYLLVKSADGRITLETIPASFFQSLNSIFVVSFAPFFAWLWIKLGKYEPSAPSKMAWGLFLLSLGYLWIAFGVNDIAPGIKVSMIWLTGMYAMHTCGELCLSPIGMSLVNKLSPLKYASLLMAVWFLANAFANKFAGVLSGLYPEPGVPKFFLTIPINNLFEFFILFVVMSAVASAILFALSKRLQKLMHGVR